MLEFLQKLAAFDFEALRTAVLGLFAGLIGIFLMIPGEQPEKFLYSANDKVKKVLDFVVDLVSKLSRK